MLLTQVSLYLPSSIPNSWAQVICPVFFQGTDCPERRIGTQTWFAVKTILVVYCTAKCKTRDRLETLLEVG